MSRRLLTQEESGAISRLAETLAPDSHEQLVADLQAAEIEPATSTNPAWRFEIPGYLRPADDSTEILAVEGIVDDSDGSPVVVWLELDRNQRVFEVQFDRLRS